MNAQPLRELARETIRERLDAVRERMATAERRFGRPPGAATLLAVSKGVPVATLLYASECEQRRFGESYLQEALPKVERLRGRGIEWHYIGSLQSNKTRTVAERFDWVQGVSRLDIARRLSAQRPAELTPLNVCLQVNVSRDPNKSGVPLEDLLALAESVSALPRLRLRGLMTVPAQAVDFAEQRRPFCVLREAQEDLQRRGLKLDTLSMGMSSDLEAAIAEGATLVRIGTAIFGARSLIC
jgi:PLP dependent protein